VTDQHQQLADALPAVADFGFTALTEHDLGAVMAEACHLVRSVLECDEAVIFTHGAESDAETRTLVQAAIDTDQPVLVNDVRSEQGYRSILSVTINGPYAPFGTLNALSRRPQAFNDRDGVFIRSIANLVGGAMARRAAEDESSRAQLEREARLQLILGNLPVIIWTTDRDLSVTSLGGAGMQISTDVGTTLEELMGDRDFASELSLPLAGRAVTLETRMIERDVRARIEPFRDADGAIVGTVGIAYDVTEHMAAERTREELLEVVARSATEWRDTFDSIGSAVLLLDAEHRVARLNAAALALAGLPHYRDVVGRRVETISGLALWSKVLDAAVSSRRSDAPVTLRVRGAERRWDVVVTSGAAHTTVVVSDVTAIARMEDDLQRSERMSSIGALVAGVAHEVRNPLFGISATLDAFEARFGGEQYQRYTRALRDQLQRMNELMYDLLELGRPASSVLAPGAIAPVITTALSSVHILALRSGVSLRTQLAPDLPDVPMDRPRLLQVFENLLRNAIQHSATGSIVEVHAARQGDRVAIRVEDRGPGFRDEDLPRVFEPFFTRRRGGTGLGLSLVQRIVDDHHGQIEARNREGGGASVRVALSAGPTP
jgi:signal transduction histidine kinase